jgi:hypothetical protein
MWLRNAVCHIVEGHRLRMFEYRVLRKTCPQEEGRELENGDDLMLRNFVVSISGVGGT